MRRSRALLLWFGCLVALGLWGRAHSAARSSERCSLDGQRIVPLYRVDLVRGDAVEASFCCIACARSWPEPPSAGAWWRVRDEMSGQPLDASRACFVESEVETNTARHCRWHAFKDWPAAMDHAARFGGRRASDPLASGTVPTAEAQPPPRASQASEH